MGVWTTWHVDKRECICKTCEENCEYNSSNYDYSVVYSTALNYNFPFFSCYGNGLNVSQKDKQSVAWIGTSFISIHWGPHLTNMAASLWEFWLQNEHSDKN